MRDGTFLRCIFLCFLFKANEVGLPVATWARHSDTRDTLTSHSQSLTESHHLQPLPTTTTAQRQIHTHAMTHKHTGSNAGMLAHILYVRMHTRTRTSWVISWTFVINSHSGLMFTAYSLSKPQTCLFLLSQNSKHPLSKDFFFCVSLACLFFQHAFRSPTNELNTEETWKRLDEAWLFEQWGDDIVPYDYTYLYQQKQGASSKVCSFSQLRLVG